MASRQHSKTRRTRKRVQSFSHRSDWAAYMNGAEPEWLHSKAAGSLAEAFEGHFPAWLIEAEPWRQVTAAGFQIYRRDIMGLTVAQCAAYLRVSRAMVSRWESGSSEVPFAAFEALRLQYCSAAYRLSHKHWDGWFINRKTGELVSPDIGKLAVKPAEVNSLRLLYGQLSTLQSQVEQQAKKIDAMEAENARLRDQARYRQVAAELETMQGRIGALLEGIRTAEVFHFSKPADETPLRAVA